MVAEAQSCWLYVTVTPTVRNQRGRSECLLSWLPHLTQFRVPCPGGNSSTVKMGPHTSNKSLKTILHRLAQRLISQATPDGQVDNTQLLDSVRRTQSTEDTDTRMACLLPCGFLHHSRCGPSAWDLQNHEANLT